MLDDQDNWVGKIITFAFLGILLLSLYGAFTDFLPSPRYAESYARKLVMAFFQAAWVSFDITGRPSLNSIPLMISGSLFGPSSLRHRFLAEQTSW